MTNQYDLREMQIRLSEFVERAAAGEEFAVLKDGKPIARLEAVPADHPAHVRKQKRSS
ncbi:MAG: type II toxin-antitoxin system Phd/YefM family antitoxin [Actinomycetota bacterium]